MKFIRYVKVYIPVNAAIVRMPVTAFTAPEGVRFSGQAIILAEMGAKAGLVHTTGLQLPYEFGPVLPDPAANYRAVFKFDITNLQPQIAVPHSPDNVVDLSEAVGQPIQMAFIGSCTNSRLEDWHAAAKILQDKQVAPGVRLLIAPASKVIFDAALQDGTVKTLTDAGAVFITSGCGPCVGTHLGVPGDGEVTISSTNRNFQGRMGNPNSEIFLASPAVVAAAAVAGEIIDPGEL